MPVTAAGRWNGRIFKRFYVGAPHLLHRGEADYVIGYRHPRKLAGNAYIQRPDLVAAGRKRVFYNRTQSARKTRSVQQLPFGIAVVRTGKFTFYDESFVHSPLRHNRGDVGRTHVYHSYASVKHNHSAKTIQAARQTAMPALYHYELII